MTSTNSIAAVAGHGIRNDFDRRKRHRRNAGARFTQAPFPVVETPDAEPVASGERLRGLTAALLLAHQCGHLSSRPLRCRYSRLLLRECLWFTRAPPRRRSSDGHVGLTHILRRRWYERAA
jgi:hypothetical protein